MGRSTSGRLHDEKPVLTGCCGVFLGGAIGKQRDWIGAFGCLIRIIAVTDFRGWLVVGCIGARSHVMAKPIAQFFDHGFNSGPMKGVFAAFDELLKRTKGFVVFIKARIERTKLMPKPFMVGCDQQTMFDDTCRKGQFTRAKRTNLYVVLKSQQNIDLG